MFLVITDILSNGGSHRDNTKYQKVDRHFIPYPPCPLWLHSFYGEAITVRWGCQGKKGIFPLY